MDPNKLKVKFQEIADERSLSWFGKINQTLLGIWSSVIDLKSSIPKVFQIAGKVEVDSIKYLPPIKISNFPDPRGFMDDINKMFIGLQNSILKLAQESKISIPDNFRINKIDSEVKIKDWTDLIDAMEELKKGFNLLLNREGKSLDGPIDVSITNFPPQL